MAILWSAKAAKRSGLTQALGRMKKLSRHDVVAVMGACLAWLVFLWAGAGAWGLFIPLLFVSVLFPSVLTSALDASPPVRQWLGALPSVLAAIWVAVFSHHEWATLIWQCIAAGAAVGLVISLAMSTRSPRAA